MCGCDCNGCGGLPFCSGNLFVIAERLVSYLALTAVVCCIVILFATSMGIGIGLGYNYCVVDLKVRSYTPKPGQDLGSEEEQNLRRQFDTRSVSPAMDATTVTVTVPAVAVEKYTLTLPLHGNMDFAALLAKLRARNKNITLELVT